jgi:hypothetical protein
MLSRESIEAMSEDDLRKSVLIPLFRQMGYRDVMDHHGGADEQGKDVVMWTESPTGSRLNYAVVVKKKMSGQASGRGSAGEVAFQVLQCFGAGYLTGELSEAAVHRVLVVCSSQASPTGRKSLASGLGQLTNQVELLDGPALWDQIETHMGPWAVVGEHLSRSKGLAREIGAAVVIRTEGDSVELAIGPFSGAAKMRAKIVIPENDPEAAAIRQKVSEHLERGTVLEVPAKHVELEGDVPGAAAWWRALDRERGLVRFAAPVPRSTAVWDLAVEGEDGRQVSLRGIPLTCKRLGTAEIELQSSPEGGPWLVRCLFDWSRKRSTIEIELNEHRASASEVRDFLTYLDIASQGCQLRMALTSSGIVVFRTSTPLGAAERPEPALLRFVEKVALIQELTETFIQIPAGEITVGQAEEVEKAWAVVSGRPLTVVGGHFTVQSTVGKLRELEGDREVAGLMTYHQLFPVLGHMIDLGPAECQISQARISDESWARLKQLPAGADPTTPVEVRVEQVPGSPASATWPQWQSRLEG